MTPEQRIALVEYIAHLSTRDWGKLAVDLQTLGFIPPEVDTQVRHVEGEGGRGERGTKDQGGRDGYTEGDARRRGERGVCDRGQAPRCVGVCTGAQQNTLSPSGHTLQPSCPACICAPTPVRPCPLRRHFIVLVIQLLRSAHEALPFPLA